MKKRLSLLMVLMMVLSLVPMSAFAAAGTMPGGRVEADDNETVVKQVTVKLTQAAYTDLKVGKTRLTLSAGEFAVHKKDVDKDNYYKNLQSAEFNVGEESIKVPAGSLTTSTVKVTTPIELDGSFANVAYVNVPSIGVQSKDMDIILTLYVLFDEESAGDVTLAVEEVNDSNLKVADPIKVAVIKVGLGDDLAMVVADATKRIGNDGGKLSKVEVKKFDKSAASTIALELPDYLSWDMVRTESVSVDGLKVNITAGMLSGDHNNILTVPVTTNVSKAILVEPIVTVVKRDASEGDINLKVTSYTSAGKKIESVDSIIGVLGNYDVVMSAVEKGKKEIPAIYGGEEVTVKVKVKGVEGSFTKGRDIDFTIKGADIVTSTTTGSIDGKTNEGINPLSGKTSVVSTKAEDGIVKDGEFTLKVIKDPIDVKDFEFELKLKVDYAQSGAVVLTANSRDIGTVECELAKVTPAYTVEFANITSIKKGENKATADIVIKEAKAGMLDSNEFVVVNLRGQSFANAEFGPNYKVETTNGLKVEDKYTKDSTSKKGDNRAIVLDVKSTSSKEAGTITISNLLVNVNASAVDGDKMLDTYVVEAKDSDAAGFNDRDIKNAFDVAVERTVNDSKKDPDYAKAYVTVVKEYGTTATTTVFKVGSKAYTVNGVAMTANEAPFIAGKGYTMLPVRAMGEALGLKADWNAATKTATFSNDSKVASVVIGADTMYVNGTPFKLSAKAVIKNGSTFVELRSLASAFGVELQWDAATKMVTIIG